jgi:hypothetical protein
MSTPTNPPTGERQSRDAAYWASAGTAFHASSVPAGALNWLEGREITGPLRGFGQLWQKTYTIEMAGLSLAPPALISAWKENFGKFWPKGNRFYRPLAGITPGEVALINSDLPGGATLGTGVMVLYVDEESFTFITPQGHVFAGWITFSAFEREHHTVAQVQILIRAPDPLMEIALRLGGHRQEDIFWQQTLRNLARHFGVEAHAETRLACLDKRLSWSNARNIRYNPMFKMAGYALSAPMRFFANSRRG